MWESTQGCVCEAQLVKQLYREDLQINTHPTIHVYVGVYSMGILVMCTLKYMYKCVKGMLVM